MRPLVTSDLILDLEEYAAHRDELRAATIALKRKRRVALGDLVTLVFENRDTLRFQVMEMVFAEHITDPGRIDEELETYNPLLPTSHGLCATLFLEFPDSVTLTAELPRYVGIEDSFALLLDGHRIPAVGASGRSRADYAATVHYLRFTLSDAQRDLFRDPTVAAEITVEHAAYADSATLSGDTRLSLLADLSLDA